MTARLLVGAALLLLAPADDPERLRALIEQDWRTAVERTAELFAADADDPHVRAVHGAALFRAGRLPEAERVLGPLETASEARGLTTLARLRAASGAYESAGALVERALGVSPDDPEVLFWSAGLGHDRELSAVRLERFLRVASPDDADRRDSARMAIGLYRALGDTVVWDRVNRPETVTLPLRPLWNPAGGVLQGYLVQVTLGTKKRKPVWLMLDTGSPGLFVIERIARKRGFEPLADQLSFGGGGDRKHTTQRGMFDEVAFGPLRFRNALASVDDIELDPIGRFHGVVGLSAFSGYRVVLDLPGRRLHLRPPSDSAMPGSSRYWSVEGQLLVPARLGPGDAEALFLLDTGATGTMVSDEWARRLDGARLGTAADVRGIGGSLGAVALSGVTVDFLGNSVGPDGLRAAPFDVRSRMGGVEIAGFLGLDLLGDARIEIDDVARRVRIEREQPRLRGRGD